MLLRDTRRDLILEAARAARLRVAPTPADFTAALAAASVTAEGGRGAAPSSAYSRPTCGPRVLGCLASPAWGSDAIAGAACRLSFRNSHQQHRGRRRRLGNGGPPVRRSARRLNPRRVPAWTSPSRAVYSCPKRRRRRWRHGPRRRGAVLPHLPRLPLSRCLLDVRVSRASARAGNSRSGPANDGPGAAE
jgi:hypothetical protein